MFQNYFNLISNYKKRTIGPTCSDKDTEGLKSPEKLRHHMWHISSSMLHFALLYPQACRSQRTGCCCGACLARIYPLPSRQLALGRVSFSNQLCTRPHASAVVVSTRAGNEERGLEQPGLVTSLNWSLDRCNPRTGGWLSKGWAGPENWPVQGGKEESS